MDALHRKLRIREGTRIHTLNAPKHLAALLGTLPKDAELRHGITKGHDFIHLFARTRSELERDFPKAVRALAPNGLLWVSFPKRSSGMQTDLDRDQGWDMVLAAGLRWMTLISLDATWSAFLVRNEAPVQQKANAEHHANSAAWADPSTKTVRVPDDLAAAFTRERKARAAFDALAYTHRKEYVLWLVSAKRETTRTDRVWKIIAKLLDGTSASPKK